MFTTTSHLLMTSRPNVAPPVGPIIGGALASRLGWPWIFWFLSIFSGLCLLLLIGALPETARSVVGNGSLPAKGLYRTAFSKLTPTETIKTSEPIKTKIPNRKKRSLIPNPLACLRILFYKDSAIVLYCNGINYATYCCIQASLSSQCIQIYGLNELEAGLIYLPFGLGCLLASYFSGTVLAGEGPFW